MAKILLIDDDPLVIKSWKSVFQRASFEVDVSYQQKFTLVCGALRADLILMDVNMPQIDGVSLSQALQAHWPADGAEGRPHVYLFSSLPEEDLERLARKASADGYICKLWPVEHVVSRVREILASAPDPAGACELPADQRGGGPL